MIIKALLRGCFYFISFFKQEENIMAEEITAAVQQPEPEATPKTKQ